MWWSYDNVEQTLNSVTWVYICTLSLSSCQMPPFARLLQKFSGKRTLLTSGSHLLQSLPASQNLSLILIPLGELSEGASCMTVPQLVHLQRDSHHRRVCWLPAVLSPNADHYLPVVTERSSQEDNGLSPKQELHFPKLCN